MPKAGPRILMVSSEVASFARTGGLGDVVEALSRELAELGAEVIVVTPLYGVTKVPAGAAYWEGPIRARYGWAPEDELELGVLETRYDVKGSGSARVCLIAEKRLFDRQGIYGDAHGEFGDNALRFATLSSAALAVSERAWSSPDAGGGPDVIHAHDWHAALSVIKPRLSMGPAWAARPSVFTIHNLAFQGVLGFDALDPYGIPRDAWHHGWVAHEGNVNLMKGAIELASHVTTVSETYAKEILDHHHGYGLDAHLRHHAAKLSGIVNGIDVSSYDPSSDPVLAKRYDAASSAAGKLANKMALAAETGLDPEGPLLACISRLTWQKGIDIIAHALPGLVAEGARVLFVGQGDPALERELREAEQRYPRLVATRVVFDPLLARRVFAGSDFLLVPSRYEPCGLTQMYAMRYGSLPIVTAVGGLKDTVSDGETGIVMQSPDPGALIEAGRRAVKLYRDEVARRAMITRAMARDSSWGRSAQKYLELYATLGEPP